jgi:glycosyltransferase involved in cell wall biosynthesis
LAHRVSTIISPSQYLATLAKQQGYPTPTVIPHGIEPHLNKHIGGGGFVFIGTMEPHKGPHIVEQAYIMAFPDHSVPIHFIGNGSIQVQLPQEDGIPREEVFERLQHADALIMGSIWPENYPMILLEAKSIGCPVIAPSIGGIPEIITQNKDGLLYSPGNVQMLATQMQQIRSMNLSPSPPRTQSEMVHDHLRLYDSVRS